MSRVYVILVNWNGWRDTLECLESLEALRFPSCTTIVCDNGSTDDSVARIAEWAAQRGVGCAVYDADEAAGRGALPEDPPLVLIRTGANLGFAGGNNAALRYALSAPDFRYAWLLNNDTVVDPDALSFLVERMERDSAVGMCGSTIRLYHDRTKVQALGGGHYCRWIGLPWHYGRFNVFGKADADRAERWLNYVEGASLLVSRRFLEEVGLMCEDYFLYFEEADWAMRGKGRFTLGYAPESVVYHKVGGSIGTSSNPARKSLTCDFFNIRNRILFTRRYHRGALPTVYLVLLGGLLVRFLLGRWGRVAMMARLLLSADPAGVPLWRPEGQR